ncbi:MAG: sodium:solute symporter, partial [Planctomycetes bacterium]|nr:sodium:solute symporter [Planctomycetota bacterium]
MSSLDWILFVGFLVYVIYDGMRRARENRDAVDVFLAGRSAPWWVIGLSVMATQASAITMVGTTGTGWDRGMRFLQFYYALPLAMVVLAVTLAPLYHRHKVFTAYEYLGLRFD